jgi:hypothetical protein
LFPEGGDEGFAALTALELLGCFSFSRYERGTSPSSSTFEYRRHALMETPMGRGLLLWLIGIPIPIILLIWLFGGLHG